MEIVMILLYAFMSIAMGGMLGYKCASDPTPRRVLMAPVMFGMGIFWPVLIVLYLMQAVVTNSWQL